MGQVKPHSVIYENFINEQGIDIGTVVASKRDKYFSIVSKAHALAKLRRDKASYEEQDKLRSEIRNERPCTEVAYGKDFIKVYGKGISNFNVSPMTICKVEV